MGDYLICYSECFPLMLFYPPTEDYDWGVAEFRNQEIADKVMKKIQAGRKVRQELLEKMAAEA